jgi:hypothetical protein
MKPVISKPSDMKPFSNGNESRPDSRPNISFNDELETFEIPVNEEILQIGEDIPLNMLSFEDLEKATPCDIDLDIVEL